jgi:hypothetical protein
MFVLEYLRPRETACRFISSAAADKHRYLPHLVGCQVARHRDACASDTSGKRRRFALAACLRGVGHGAAEEAWLKDGEEKSGCASAAAIAKEEGRRRRLRKHTPRGAEKHRRISC